MTVENRLKAGKDERTVILPEKAVELIERIHTENLKAGHIGPWLFYSPTDGARMRAFSVETALRKVCTALSLAPNGNHAIKRTVLSEMVQSGMFSVAEVQEQAGHDDPQTTLRYYVNLMSDTDDRSRRMDTLVPKQG